MYNAIPYSIFNFISFNLRKEWVYFFKLKNYFCILVFIYSFYSFIIYLIIYVIYFFFIFFSFVFYSVIFCFIFFLFNYHFKINST